MKRGQFNLSPGTLALVDILATPSESVDDVVGRLLESSAIAHLVRVSPSEFERVVGRSLEAQGYDVEHVGGRGDQGIDLVGKRGTEFVAVQCKRYGTSEVTPHQVREFLGAIVAARATRGVLVTTSMFTHAARIAANGQPIEFVDQKGLAAWLTQGPANGRIRRCSKCGSPAISLTEWSRAFACASCKEFNSIP